MNAHATMPPSGADAALAAALFDEAEQGERAILAGKVDPRHAIAYRRKVKMLRLAAERLSAHASSAPEPAQAGEVDPYRTFLERKIPVSQQDGFEVDPGEINPRLKDFTRVIVRWALGGGRRGLFLNFGLHKTVTQLELARLALKYGKGPALITLPLGVTQEFAEDAEQFFTGDHAIKLRFIRSTAEIDDDAVLLTNYEPVRDGKIDVKQLGFSSLDEAAVLRGYGTKTFQQFLPLFAGVPLRFVATATPAPNRTKELIHYGGYLGIMDTGQALTRFFQRNSSKAGDLQLYPHKEDEFWTWVHSWALFLQKPSDLGFADDGYVLPPLDVRWHEVASDHGRARTEEDGQGVLMQMPAMGLQEAARERRASMPARIAKVKEIVASDPAAHFIHWHYLEDEREALCAAIPGAFAIFGTQDQRVNERLAVNFKHGRFQHLATKPSMSGAGCNFQLHCHRATMPVDYGFHDFIQAIHRLWRFGQAREVIVDIVHSEAERGVVAVLKEKWAEHERLMARMAEIIRRYGLSHAPAIETLRRSIGVTRVEVRGQNFVVANNDCVAEARRTAANSVGLIVTSVPFANHYEYTAQYEDFGHTDDNGHFWQQMDFLTGELHRILQPGRLACIHVKDRVLFGAVTGAGVPTISPFHAEAIFHFRRHGFDYAGMITVVTDVVRENNQTYRLGYSENAKDSTKMGVGCPEYILLMRKPQSDRSRGYADTPVTKIKPPLRDVASWSDPDNPDDMRQEQVPEAPDCYSLARWQVDAHAFWRSSGDRLLSPKEFADAIRQLGMDQITAIFQRFSLAEIYDHDYVTALGEHLGDRLPKTFMALAPASAHPAVWTNVNRMLTLNSNQAQRRAQLHICPLQFDIVDRLITRYSNEGDLVYDPFCGLGTVPYRALRLRRRGQGSELDPVSFKDSVHYLQAFEAGQAVPTLFDVVGRGEAA
jgi:DNA modification methylase